jgi:Ca-activated chloride channel family protein
MSFIWPPMLLLLLAIPLGAGLFLLLERRRGRRGAAYGISAAAARPEVVGLRRQIPAACLLTGLTILLLSLARPQSVVSVPRIEGTAILAFDVSGSMAADDMEPTRMEAAKTAARAFVERQPASIRLGVVAFSDSGFSVQVPTNDQSLVLAAINRLAPERGTSLGRGIETSLTTLANADADPAAGFYTNRSPGPTAEPTPVPDGTYAPAAIVLLTDGENTQSPDPLIAAQAAADRGVRIFTIGIGSAEGSTIEVEGSKVHSRLDEPMLRQLSDLTDGAFYAAEDPEALSAIYASIGTQLVVRDEAMEVTSLVAGAGVLVLLVGGIASLRWLGRWP